MPDGVEPESKSSVGVDRARKTFTQLVARAEDGITTRLHLEREGHTALLAPVSELGAAAVGRLRRVSLTDARPKLGGLVKDAAEGAPCVLERKGTPVALVLAEPDEQPALPAAGGPRPALLAEILRSTTEPYADVTFGLPSLDGAVQGLTRGRLVAIAAEPGAGGSLLAVAAARTTAIDLGKPVLYAASGLCREDVAARMVAGHLALPYQRLRSRTLPEEQQQAADAYEARLHAPLYIDDEDLTAEVIAQSAACMGELALVVVDRLQAEEREGVALSGRGLPDAARGLAALARRLRVPVLAVVDSDSPQVLASLHADVTLTVSREQSRAEVAVWERDFGALEPVRLAADLTCARFAELTAAAAPHARELSDARAEQPPAPVRVPEVGEGPAPVVPAQPPARPAAAPAAQESGPAAADQAAGLAPAPAAQPDPVPRPGAWPAGARRSAPATPVAEASSGAGAAVSPEGVGEDEQAATAAPTASSKRRRFDHGPFAVLDGEGFAYLSGGRTQACKANTVAEVAQWALARPFGTPRAKPHAHDRDPLVVLMPKAAEQLGLPAFPDSGTRALPVGHPVLADIEAAGWKTTRRGDDPWFSSWPRVYQPVTEAGERRSVQFAVLSWGALSKDGWTLPFDDDTGEFPLPVTEVIAFLDAYGSRTTTPVSTPAATSLELMRQTRPSTRPWNYAKPGDKPRVAPAWVKGALHAAVDPAPCEATDEHPLARGRDHRDPSQALNEEGLQWWREPTKAERQLKYVVTIDVSCAFGAGANRTRVGLCAPYHVEQLRFDKDLPGTWLADLSEVSIPKGLPSPFTPDGEPPTGPGWYDTHTIAYAIERGFRPGLLEANVRPSAEQARALGITPHPPLLVDPDEEGNSKYPPVPPFGNGQYLTPWYEQLRDGLLATYARLGVDARRKGEDPAVYAERFLAAMACLDDEDFRAEHATDWRVLNAIKATFKYGIGKFRERDHRSGGRSRDPHAPWPALKRPEWRPDIRAAVIARSRANMHRKIIATMEAVGAVPLAIKTDAITYASATDDILGLVGHKSGFQLGPNPGYVKAEPVHSMDWYLSWADKKINPAAKVKSHDDGGE